MIGENKGKKQKPVNSSQAKALILMAPQVRLELTTLRLTAECSAIELLRKNRSGFHIAKAN